MPQHQGSSDEDTGTPRADRVADAHDESASDRSPEYQAVVNEEDALASGEENPS